MQARKRRAGKKAHGVAPVPFLASKKKGRITSMDVIFMRTHVFTKTLKLWVPKKL
jgi:hypothetical protein